MIVSLVTLATSLVCVFLAERTFVRILAAKLAFDSIAIAMISQNNLVTPLTKASEKFFESTQHLELIIIIASTLLTAIFLAALSQVRRDNNE